MASLSTFNPDPTSANTGNKAMGRQPSILEHIAMVMISAPLNGSNWLSWNGSYGKPVEGSAEYRQWRISDSIVRTWILNAISKDIVNAYLYANSARALWLELEARYGECDGPLLYKIQLKLALSLKSLVLDPLPHVNKAYSMVLRVERQCQVNLDFMDVGDSTMMGRGIDQREMPGSKNFLQCKDQWDKWQLFCSHFHKSKHNRESCFKLHGTPDWYRDLTEQRKKNALREGLMQHTNLWLTTRLEMDGATIFGKTHGTTSDPSLINSHMDLIFSSSVIREGQWHWPIIINIKCLEITQALPAIYGGIDPQALYRLWKPRGTKVAWAALHSGSLKIPRHLFTLWMAILGKLPTMDKP
ncbi:UNVERIFIED_CONTAM: hypothetical protein Sindi_0964700 [Sesamum indicum]